MGYRFWELYLFRRQPNIRWRGGPAEIYYKELAHNPWDRKRMRKEFAVKKILLPITLGCTCLIAGYYMLKGQGMLHVLQNPVEGAKEYYHHTLGRHIESHFKDERALRQREAYKKALEEDEKKIMEQFKKYETKE